jgi:streptomycin 3"-adenylyltransferase
VTVEAGKGRLQCSSLVRLKLRKYAEQLQGLLGANVRGVYVYGSLARGCFHPSSSDVAVIVIISEDVEPDASEVARIHRSSGLPLDAVFVTEEQIRKDAFPTPVSFLVKPMDNFAIVHPAADSSDLLLQRQDAFEAGVAILGPEPRESIRPVPWPLLARSLDALFPHIVPRFKNGILMLCRVAYARENHSLCSKKCAGEWAINAFGTRWAPIISSALAEYASGCSCTSISESTLRAFEHDCAGYSSGLPSGGKRISCLH